MSADTLFLDNIDEYVNDENKIVTFKWLSQTLQVNCNTAKQMLYQYIQNERNNKDRDGLTVTYFLSGLSQPDEHGLQTFKCVVVPEEKLGLYKTSFAVMTSCHIYSVQKPVLKDSNVLYMTDYDKFKENVFEANKYSSIQCERAVLRDQEEMEMLTLNTVPAVESKTAPKTNAATTSTSGSKGGQKGMPKSAIANMFAKTTTSKKGADADVVKKETKTEQPKPAPAKATGKAAAKKAGGVTAFFSKQTGKKADAPDKKETKKASPDKTASKKTPRTPDSDDEEEEVVRSKRRRTGQGLFDSDSSAGEEEMDVESEEPIPPTPPPTKRVSPTPQVKDSSPDVEVTKKAIPKKSPKEESSSKGGNTETGKGDNTSGERRKYRRRKQVDKNYMDDEGFMVTEKVWESESASEAEDPIPPKQVKKSAPAKSPVKGKKASPKKPSPGKKNSGKQTSLMSFFKKS